MRKNCSIGAILSSALRKRGSVGALARLQRLLHHGQHAIGFQQDLRRAADMAAIGENLAVDFELKPLYAGCNMTGITQAKPCKGECRRGFQAR